MLILRLATFLLLLVLLLLADVPPCDEVFGQLLRNRHFGQTSFRLSVGPNRRFVDRLRNGERDRFHAMTLPPEREQLARAKCIRHIEFEQNPVAKAELGQGRCELFPAQYCLVRLPQVRGSPRLRKARTSDIFTAGLASFIQT
jgi:hypothetical protein